MQQHPGNIHQSFATPRYSATPCYVLIQLPAKFRGSGGFGAEKNEKRVERKKKDLRFFLALAKPVHLHHTAHNARKMTFQTVFSPKNN